MKTLIVTLACLCGMTMLGGHALASNSAATSPHSTAVSSSWCTQHQQECRERMQKHAEWCNQHQQDCHSLVQLDAPMIKQYCKQHPQDARCEKLKHYRQNRQDTKPVGNPPPGA